MKSIEHWPELADQGNRIIGIEYNPSDRQHLFRQFLAWAEQQQLSVYVHNPGFKEFKKIIQSDDRLELIGTNWKHTDPFDWLLDTPEEGIFLLEGFLGFNSNQNPDATRIYQIINGHLQNRHRQFWVCFELSIVAPSELKSQLPVLRHSPATAAAIKSALPHKNPPPELVRACQGLYLGEIENVVNVACQATPEDLSRALLDYKISKLRGFGLQFFSEPDVESACGLELLDQYLESVAALLDPEAKKYGLAFPKGCILWGPPGTGKSLSAKLTAKRIGVPLICLDWGGLLGSSNPDAVLRQTIQYVEDIAPVVLALDDFDKGFSGWDSNADGGKSRRLSGFLLTWMQERQSEVFVIATVNRLQMLPPELIRRFDEIFFCGLPHEGARYEVFKSHLQQYFPDFELSDDDWRRLLRDYRMCTAAEIAKAVRQTAIASYYRHYKTGDFPDRLTSSLQALQQQRNQFIPAMIRESEQMYAILNRAAYARSASAPDESIFATPKQSLFD